MLTLLYIGIVFVVVVAAVAIYAVLSAEDGFEDGFGFHAVFPTWIPELSDLAGTAASETPTEAFPPLAATR